MDSDGLEPRVAALEDQVRHLAGRVDANRQDFVDLRDHVDQRFDHVDRGFAEMRGKFDAAAAGQQQIVDLLQTIVADGRGKLS